MMDASVSVVVAICSVLAVASVLAIACNRPAERESAAVDVAALLVRADELERSGDVAGALAQAEAAIDAGGGRDAAVTAAKLAITLAAYDKAAAWLEPIVQRDPTDAIAQYDLALVHHRKSDYNRARHGYLAALRADPQHADARYNLAILCWDKGVREEARHHAERFVAAFPTDPRGAELQARVTGAP